MLKQETYDAARTAARLRIPAVLLLCLALFAALPAQAQSQSQTQTQSQTLTSNCPALAPYIAGQQSRGQAEWLAVANQLNGLLTQCLDSSEYFALLGAAWLNAGLLAQAIESLERALLLNPENGAAQIDFAEALYRDGQWFAAIALNEQLLARADLPANLRPALQRRLDDWRAATRSTSFRGDVRLGYDSNLNGAPDPDQVTLTLAGDNVLLALGEEFRAISGPYANLGLAANHSRLTPGRQHNFSAEIQGRVSDDRNTDLLQFDARYHFLQPRRGQSWQLDSGLRSVAFGGSTLFTAADVQFRYSISPLFTCRPFFDASAQYQLFHNQNWLNAFDTRLGGGFACPVGRDSATLGDLSIAASLLHSQAIKPDRPGGNRRGWQAAVNWQRPLPTGLLRAVLNHTRLEDNESYSPLLEAGAPRWVNRSYFLLQYRRAVNLGAAGDLLINFYHQQQGSNIGLFDTSDTTFEIGFSFAF